MNGAEYIAEFLRQRGTEKIFLITGGACSFIVDAIGRNKGVKYYCFQHEQAAAMAADALWRTQRKVGATVVTSGPGATNLITGIACSFFDSIPTIHITGQVNQNEKKNYKGTSVRQAGFQETKIVEMVKPITKYAVQVTNGEELKQELEKAYNESITGRMGPVLIDVPMDVQKEEVGDTITYSSPKISLPADDIIKKYQATISAFLKGGSRPLVLFGAGVGLGGSDQYVSDWLLKNGIPFVSTWNGMTYFNHDLANYYGHIGVYGNRGANFLIQNCDRLLVLGSRLDNRQRSGDTESFAIGARVLVVDVDDQELKKYNNNSRHEEGILMNLCHISSVLDGVAVQAVDSEWIDYCNDMKARYFGRWESTSAQKYATMSPYDAVKKINTLIKDDAVVVADDGANLCWVFQAFHRQKQAFFTAGGNSPMGYSFPASIGAALYDPQRQIIAFTGDGSMQMNVQELQTMAFNNLNIKLFILNNFGYGIIKQFQDLYFDSRYHATGQGYSQPDFGKVSEAYGIPYVRIETVEEITRDIIDKSGPMVIDLILHPMTMIEPKLEMGRSIEDQFPYLEIDEYEHAMKFVDKKRKS
jgi:acetolactate synthase-1/2/3 large subunit